MNQNMTKMTKIYDFIWQDPEEYLNDGRLELSASAEEQPTFEQIVSILPQSILAKTGETAENTSADEAGNITADEAEDTSADEAEDITADYDVEIEVSSWQCADYIQNEDGMWPTSGSFIFAAELEDGYELADRCAPLAVEVAVSDEAAMLATEAETYMAFSRRKDNTSVYTKLLKWDGTNLSGNYTEFLDGSSRIYRDEDENAFVLELNNYTTSKENNTQLEIRKGKWIIELNGTSKFDSTTLPKNFSGFGLQIWGGTDVTFTGSGTLNVRGDQSGIDIGIDATVSIQLDQGGIINATSPYSVNESEYNRHGIASWGNLTITSGTVTAEGPYSGLYQRGGRFEITGGTLKAKVRGGNGSRRGLYFCKESECLLGGTIETDGLVLDNATGSISGNVTVDHLSLTNMSDSLLTIESDGILNINKSILFDVGKNKLVNYGELQVNMTSDSSKPIPSNYENHGCVTGSQAENWRTPSSLKAVLGTSEKKREKVNENEDFNVSTLFNSSDIDSEEGKVSYYYVNQADSEKKEQTLSSSTTKFAAGNYIIGAKTQGNETYKAGSAVAYIYVNSDKFSVVPIEFVYTGLEQKLLKVYTPNDKEYTVEYQCYEPQSSGEFYVNNWTTTPPTATNCGDKSLKHYYAVRITASDSDQPLYQITYNGTSSEGLLHVTSIKPKSLQSDDIVVTLTPQTFRYDGTVKKPAIKIIDTVIKTEVKRYGISYSYATGGAADNPKEAGTYKVHIYSFDANYTGDRYVYFTIEKQKLTPVAVISNASKTYDGTTALASGQTIALTLQDEDGNPVSDGVSASYETAAYESKDVGPNSIQITRISLTGENADKYDLSTSTLSISGNIDRASAEKLVSNVAYPGNSNVIEYENRGTFLPTVTVSSTISSDQVGSYAVSYSAAQEGPYVSDLKDVMQNLNAQETEQTIYYRITTQNYESATRNFTVKIIPSSLNGKGIVVTAYNGVYDGNPHTISATLPESVPDGTIIEYKGSGESEWKQEPPSYKDAGEYTVDYKISCPNYEDLVENQTVHISQKSLTVSASPSNAQITYGDECPEFTPVYEGFVAGENENNSDLKENVDSVLKIECAYQKGSDAGVYPITLSGLTSKNYAIAYDTSGKLTVGKKEPEISAKDAEIWKETIYSGNSVDLGIQADGDGEKNVTIKNLDTGESNNYPLADVVYPSHVGHYKAELTVSEGTNYQAKAETYEFEIQKKELKITADDKTVIVGNQAPEFTASYEGFVDGEDQSVLTGTPAFTCSYDMDTSEVGTYPILLSVDGVMAADYSLVLENGTLTVTDKLIPTITTADPSTWRSRVYDGTTTDLKASADGDGVLTVTVKDAEGNILNGFPKHAGSYTTILSYAEGQTYAAKEEKYSFEILPAPLTITAEDKRVTMGDAAPEYTAVYDGFVNGEDASVLTGTLSFTCDYTSEKTEQKYVITPSGLTSGDYTITWVNGTLTAAPKPETPSGDNGSSSGSSDDSSDNSDDSGSSGNKGTANKGTQNTNSQVKKENITTDSQRGQVSDTRGVLTGFIITKSDLAKGGTPKDGLSHWVNDNGRYQLLYKDGTYAKAAAGGKGAGAGTSGNDAVGIAHEWVLVNGNWWAFGEDSYVVIGWIRDNAYGGWFYIDPQSGMKRGWIFVNGKWYYLNAKADGKGGIMLANCLTPDGYYVKEDGSWDGSDRR